MIWKLNYSQSLAMVIAGCLAWGSCVFAEDLPSPYAVDKLVIGKKAPEFTLKDMAGRTVSLSAYKGRPVLIFFWASWSPTAGEEFVSLNKLQKLYQKRGFDIIAISTDKSVSAASGFLSKNPAVFVTLHDEKLYVSKTLYKAFMIPMAFFVDRDGVVVAKRFGQQSWTEPAMIKEVDSLLGEGPRQLDN